MAVDFEYSAFWRAWRDGRFTVPAPDVIAHVYSADYRAMKYGRDGHQSPLLHRMHRSVKVGALANGATWDPDWVVLRESLERRDAMARDLADRPYLSNAEREQIMAQQGVLTVGAWRMSAQCEPGVSAPDAPGPDAEESGAPGEPPEHEAPKEAPEEEAEDGARPFADQLFAGGRGHAAAARRWREEAAA